MIDNKRKRVLFRACHRGTQESDLIIGGFVRNNIKDLDDADIESLEKLLENSDAIIFDWLSYCDDKVRQGSLLPKEFVKILGKIKSYTRSIAGKVIQ